MFTFFDTTTSCSAAVWFLRICAMQLAWECVTRHRFPMAELSDWLKKVPGTLRHQIFAVYSDASKVPHAIFNAISCSGRESGTVELLLVLSSTISQGCGDMLIATSDRVLKDAMQESWRSLTGIRKRETFFPQLLSHHGNLSRIFCFF